MAVIYGRDGKTCTQKIMAEGQAESRPPLPIFSKRPQVPDRDKCIASAIKPAARFA
jgi:hypothetical protein